MRKFFTVILTVFVLFSLSCAASARQQKDHRGGPGYRVMPAVFWENGDATVTVKEIDAGLGTGAIVGKNGLVITNWHVVAPKMLKMIAEDGTETIKMSSRQFEVCQMKDNLETCSPAKIIKSDKVRDLAILKTERQFSHAISFIDDTHLQPFDFIYSWANVSVILPVSPFRGRYINRIVPPRIGAKIEYLVFDLSLNPGGSGSPIFDRSGKCIGIAMSVTTLRGATLGIAIPSHEVVAFLRHSGIKTTLAPSRVFQLHRKHK